MSMCRAQSGSSQKIYVASSHTPSTSTKCEGRRVTDERKFDRSRIKYHSSHSSRRSSEAHTRKTSRESHNKLKSPLLRNCTQSLPGNQQKMSRLTTTVGSAHKRRGRSPTALRSHSSSKRRSRSRSPIMYRGIPLPSSHSRSNHRLSSHDKAREKSKSSTTSRHTANPVMKAIRPNKKTKIDAASTEMKHMSARKSVLDLPMPAISVNEVLSGYYDYSSPYVKRRPLSTNPSDMKEVKRKRPVILNRRDSHCQAIKDWGKRCVDAFEVIAQIGEGSYGQVRNQSFTLTTNM